MTEDAFRSGAGSATQGWSADLQAVEHSDCKFGRPSGRVKLRMPLAGIAVLLRLESHAAGWTTHRGSIIIISASSTFPMPAGRDCQGW